MLSWATAKVAVAMEEEAPDVAFAGWLCGYTGERNFRCVLPDGVPGKMSGPAVTTRWLELHS